MDFISLKTLHNWSLETPFKVWSVVLKMEFQVETLQKKKKWFHLVKPCVLKLSQNILTEHVNHSVTHPYTATESEHIHILPSLDTDII